MIKDVFLRAIKGTSIDTLRHGHPFTRSQIANEPVLKDFCEKVLRKFKSPVWTEFKFDKLALYDDKAVLHFRGSIISEIVVLYADYDKFNDGFSV